MFYQKEQKRILHTCFFQSTPKIGDSFRCLLTVSSVRTLFTASFLSRNSNSAQAVMLNCAMLAVDRKSESCSTFTSKFSSVQDGIYVLGKAHMRSTLSLRSFPSVAFETVPVLVRLTVALSRPLKEDR